MPNEAVQGWGALGDMLAGNLGTEGVYEDAMKDRYTTEKALQDARRAKSQALIDAARLTNRQAVTPGLVQRAMAGDVAAYAELGASALGSNQTMNLGQLGDAQRPHYVQNVNAAQTALEANDYAGYNQHNAAALGEEYQPVQVLGGAYVPDGMTMDAIHAVPTPEVLSRIEENEAQAQKALRAPAPRAPSASAAEAAVLAEARAAIASGAPVAAVRARLEERGYSKLAGKL